MAGNYSADDASITAIALMSEILNVLQHKGVLNGSDVQSLITKVRNDFKAHPQGTQISSILKEISGT